MYGKIKVRVYFIYASRKSRVNPEERRSLLHFGDPSVPSVVISPEHTLQLSALGGTCDTMRDASHELISISIIVTE